MSATEIRVMVLGACGMLAADLIPRLRKSGARVFLVDCREASDFGLPSALLDVIDFRSLADCVEDFSPEWIVNCAAYTAVDRAESDEETAFRINGYALSNIARAALEADARVLHISTDYVFGGTPGGSEIGRPFSEDSPCYPCGVYGRSKLLGERILRETAPDSSLIVRTSWLHGAHGSNFVHSILRAGRKNDELRVVDDQIGSPTWAGWLSATLLALMLRDARGVFHASSRGGISWCSFAEEIVRIASLDTRVLPQSTTDAKRAAPRPFFSTLDVGKLENFLGEACISWQDGLREHLCELGVMERGDE